MKEAESNKRNALHACIQRIRKGDQQAFNTLLADYTPLISAEVSRYGEGLFAQDREDLQQIAMIALYRAALGFDLEQSEVEFGLYAKICISNALVSQLRVIRRRPPEVPLEGELLGAEPEGDDPARRIREEEAYDALYARIRALLSPYENRVWSLFVSGLGAKEIAALLQKDVHSVENAVYRIRQKLRAALGKG